MTSPAATLTLTPQERRDLAGKLAFVLERGLRKYDHTAVVEADALERIVTSAVRRGMRNVERNRLGSPEAEADLDERVHFAARVVLLGFHDRRDRNDARREVAIGDLREDSNGITLRGLYLATGAADAPGGGLPCP